MFTVHQISRSLPSSYFMLLNRTYDIKANTSLPPGPRIILEDRADIPIHAIHLHSGLKADLYPVRNGDELRQSAFRRREQVDYGSPIGRVYLHSPEDLILYKLIYFGLSQQSKRSRDIAAILKSRKNDLDLDYIEGWVSRLGLNSVACGRTGRAAPSWGGFSAFIAIMLYLMRNEDIL